MEQRSIAVRVNLTFPMVLGQILKTTRKDAGVSQEDVSMAIGVAQGHFSRLERGTSVASIEQLRLWCDALGCAMWDVVEEAQGRWEKMR